MNRYRFARALLGILLLAAVGACTVKPPPPVEGELVGVQSLLSPGQKTATATVHAATQTARAAASATALTAARATATADWLWRGRRSLNRDYDKWSVISTLVARYTATTTPQTPTPTATATNTPVPTATP